MLARSPQSAGSDLLQRSTVWMFADGRIASVNARQDGLIAYRGARLVLIDIDERGLHAHSVELGGDDELRSSVEDRNFCPLPVRERMIPKTGGALRRLGIRPCRSSCLPGNLSRSNALYRSARPAGNQR